MHTRREIDSRIKDIPREDYLAAGTGQCGGCCGLLALRLFNKALGPQTIFINAAGCLSLLALFPFSAFRSFWLYTAMSSAPAGAQGVRDALDLLIAKGRLTKSEDLRVVVVTGDGAANGIGLQATLAAIQRGLDFYYLCYDNQSSANGGEWLPLTSSFGSRVGTTHVPRAAAAANIQGSQNLFEIWRAARPAYAATLSPAHPLDFLEKVARASRLPGPKLFISLTPCPTGWGIEPAESIEIARLAVDTGVWPLKETRNGTIVHTVVPRQLRPVEQYLQRQRRYAHLLAPNPQEQVLHRLQADVEGYWEACGASSVTPVT